MTSTAPVIGTVLNKNDVQDKQSGPVAVSITLAVGLVYKDGANGWKNAPTDGSIHGDQLYFNPISLTSTATLGEVVGTFYGEGARVVGKAYGAIVVDEYCKASGTTAGSFEALADPADATVGATFGGGTATETAINAIRNWQRNKVALYKGHALELNQVDDLPTDALTTETNCVFEIVRG